LGTPVTRRDTKSRTPHFDKCGKGMAFFFGSNRVVKNTCTYCEGSEESELHFVCFESFFFRKFLKLINFARRSLLSPSSISFHSSNYHSSNLHTPSISLFYFLLLLLLSSLLPLHPFPLQNITGFSNFLIAIIYSPCNTC
jgi:hypothetical protein